MDRMCETCEAALDAGLRSIGHEGASDGELRAALNGEHPPVEEHTCVDDYIRIGDHRLDANSWAALLDVSEPTGCECSHCHGADHTEGGLAMFLSAVLILAVAVLIRQFMGGPERW